MKRIAACNLCGGSSFNFLFENSDKMLGIEGKFSTVQCNHCKLIFLNPRPSMKELKRYYPKNYHSFRSINRSPKRIFLYDLYLNQAKNNIFLKLIFLPFKTLIRGGLIIPNGRILDVGCGSGEFLEDMRYLGMKVYGVEPSRQAAIDSKKRKLNVLTGTLDSLHFPSDFFDVITLNHVLEHAQDPLITLKELKRIIKPTGIIIIAVPNSDSLVFNFLGRHWIGLDAPRHLYAFSPSTLKKYASSIGLRIDKIRYNSVSIQFLGTLQNIFNEFRSRKFQVSLSKSKLVQNQILNYALLPIAIVLNLLRCGDAIEIYLKK